jgi:integrase
MQPIQRIADGMVSVYTRRLLKGDIYYARFKITNRDVADGQRYVTESLDTTDPTIALDRARQRYAEICVHERENKAIKSGTVKAEIDEFMREYEEGVNTGLRRHSQHMLVGFRKSIVRYFVEFIGDKPIHDVSAKDMQGYEAWRFKYWTAKAAAGVTLHGNAKAKPSQRTIEWEVGAFKQFLRWANDRGRYNGDALKFRYVVDKKQSRPAFTENQFETLASYMSRKTWLLGAGKHGHDSRLSRYRAMLRTYVLFMAGTGLRPGEARNLRWRDISYDQAADEQEIIEVYVHATHSKVKKTRTTMGQDLAAVAISQLHADRTVNDDFAGPDDYIWCDTDGRVIKDFREGFNNLIKAAGVETDSMGKKLAIYSLRHYYITSRRDNTVDAYDLARNTGTSVEMIERFYDQGRNRDRKDELTKYRK